jgi:putative colanic acid biosynthesis glycosyltransferase
MSPPLFSVVTVVRNNAEGLRRTARALKAQTSQDWEWIVVDGASTDSTSVVIEEFHDIIGQAVSERDNGIYDAMNKGLRMAHGKYVFFMNSGDEFALDVSLAELTSFLSKQVAAPDLVFCGTKFSLPGGVTVDRPPKNSSYIWHGMPALHQAIAFRREAHLLVPYDLNYSVSAEYYVVASMLKNGASHALCNIAISVNELGGLSYSYRYFNGQCRDSWNVQRNILGLNVVFRLLSLARRTAMRNMITFLSYPATRCLQPIFRRLKA